MRFEVYDFTINFDWMFGCLDVWGHGRGLSIEVDQNLVHFWSLEYSQSAKRMLGSCEAGRLGGGEDLVRIWGGSGEDLGGSGRIWGGSGEDLGGRPPSLQPAGSQPAASQPPSLQPPSPPASQPAAILSNII